MTVISYSLPVKSVVTLKVYNVLGQEVASLIDQEEVAAGTREIGFDADNLASGVYFYRIVAEGIHDERSEAAPQTFVGVKKLLLMR